ncbi:MAG TPA: hypothetical protein VMU84_19415 [Thermoanaerobaculia bacterium]|nr:hypothetical protein [Thermoanaerobaculia bacterium]
MQELRAEAPIESPLGRDAVRRLMDKLREEGFTTDQTMADWEEYGEIIFRRSEKILIATGETVFIFTRTQELNERVLRQTSDAVVNTYKAKDVTDKALSVMQSTTVYHCLVSMGDQPHNEMLDQYITRSGGATFIPVVIVPEINQVLYPQLDEKVGTIRPRIEYLQYLLNERIEPVNMHRQTEQAFYVSVAVAVVLLIAVLVSLIT